MILKWTMDDPSRYAWFGYLMGVNAHSGVVVFEINPTKSGVIMNRYNRPPKGEDYIFERMK